MKKLTIVLLFPILFYSCGNNNQVENKPVTSKDSIVIINQDSTQIDGSTQATTKGFLDNLSVDGILILEPRSYRKGYIDGMWENKNFIGLFSTKSNYYIQSANIQGEIGEIDACTGDTICSLELTNSKDSCLFLVHGLIAYNKNKSEKIILRKNTVWPDEKMNFNLNGILYELKGKGILNKEKEEDQDSESWSNVQNYELILSCNGKSQTILKMKSFDDTEPVIRWIGDLDGDEKPDFIISSPEFYESGVILLFLSSKAEKDNLVKLVAITRDSFDC